MDLLGYGQMFYGYGPYGLGYDKAKMMQDLQEALSEFYCSAVLKGKPHADAARTIKDFIASSEAARSEAMVELKRLNDLNNSSGGRLSQRCYVSSMQKLGLEEALK